MAEAAKGPLHRRLAGILSLDVVREVALLKLKLQIPPRYFTDMLSCLKVNGTWKIAQKVMTMETR